MLEIKRKPQQPAGRTEMPVEAFYGNRAIDTTVNAQKRQLQPFTGLDSTRNYRTMYRAACDFHERHNPPRWDADRGLAYWQDVADDMEALVIDSGNDPFLQGLLFSVFDELEREFMTQQAGGRDE